MEFDVSVVIVNFNTFSFTRRCIESVFELTQGISFEVILVDNASTECDAQRFVHEFPDIKLIQLNTNVGFAKGNNAGILASNGRCILLLNSDTELKNNAIALAYHQLIDAPEDVAVLAGRLEYPDGSLQHNAQRFPSIWYKCLEFFRVQKLMPPALRGRVMLGAFFKHDQPVFVDWVWGTFFMFRRGHLQKLPGHVLADEFFMYVEDMMWCMEFRMRGYKVLFSPEPIVIHHMGKSGGAKSMLMLTNEAIFMKRYYRLLERYCIALLDKMLQM